MAEEVKTEVVAPDAEFEAFAQKADQRDIAAKFGKAAEPAPKVVEPDKKAEPEEKEEQEPTKDAKEPGKSVHKLGWGELRAKVRELEAENRGLREGRQPTKEELKAEEPAKAEELRARPKPDDKNEKGEGKYKTWEEYEDDLLAWHGEKTISEFEQRGAKKATEAQIKQVNKLIEDSWNERCEAAAAKYEDFDQAIERVGKLIEPGSIVDEWIMDSDLGAELLYFFDKHPEEMKKFENILPGEKVSPGKRRAEARRMLMRIEAKLTPAEKEAADEKPEPAEKEVRISKTPPPAREVGGRGAAPTDRARAAVANDDVGTYMDEMDRRDIAAKFGARR